MHEHSAVVPSTTTRPLRRRDSKRFWFFRRIPPAEEDLTKHSVASEELELLATWDGKSGSRSASTSSRNVLCLHAVDDDDDDDESSRGSESSSFSLSTVSDLRRQQELVILENKQQEEEEEREDETKQPHRLRIWRPRRPSKQQVLDLQQYMAKREMTATQERWNALTIIPSPIYCLYFLLAACWMDESLIVQAATTTPNFNNNIQQHYCFQPTFWHSMPALPPWPILAVAFGIIVHAPFSFLYHWKYAHALPAGAARTTHWSRRMDQIMIHVASTCMAFGTSGNWDFFLANVLFNGDSIYRQLQTKVRPRRNKIRIGISILAYTIPILKRGDFATFFLFWVIMGISGWLFVEYPIGGWSHAAFHLVVALEPPIIMMSAMQLPSVQEQLQVAAQCAVAAGSGLSGS